MNRSCDESALLVGGKRRLPSDPAEYNYEIVNGAGCNNLRCTACDATIRSGPPGLRLRDGRTPNDLPAMYATADWTTLRYLKNEHPAWRLYACKCSCWEEASEHLVKNDGDSPGDPRMSWVCDGHTTPELPVTLGEFVIAEVGTNSAEVVHRILSGACPRRLERDDEGPMRWLIWLRKYLLGLSVSTNLSKAVVARLDDRDDKVVGAVVAYLGWFPADPGVLEAAVAHAESALDSVLVGHALPESRYYQPRLWDVMLSAMRHGSGELGARVREVVRKVMLLPALKDDPVKEMLANSPAYGGIFREEDFRWMAENIVALDSAGPGRWSPVMELLLYAMNANEELDHLVGIGGIAMIQSGRVPADAFRTWMHRHGDSAAGWTLPLEAALTA